LSKLIKFEDNYVKNLMIFLDRVEIRGLKEIQAMNEILTALNQPIEEKNIE